MTALTCINQDQNVIHVFVWSDPFEFSGQVMLGRERSTEVAYDVCVSVFK